MKIFAFALAAMISTSSVSAHNADCDIDCMSECWEQYTQIGTASFKEYDCLRHTCKCSDYVSDNMTSLVDQIQIRVDARMKEADKLIENLKAKI